jgi:LacI family transcriptional regulator
MSKSFKVALLIETSNDYSRGLLHGIAAYIREHGQWSIYLSESSRGDHSLTWLSKWDGQGVIARIENSRISKAVKHLSIPVVDVSAARLIPSLPWVETDDVAIARLAADHLLERGFRHFAYCGDSRFNWSILREKEFSRIIQRFGFQCSICHPVSRLNSTKQTEVERRAAWLARLPKPVGIFACYDFLGRQILDACCWKGIMVPDDVAVIGVDNDELLCDLADPPLSSVIPNTFRTGYEAATLLDRMMRGKRLETRKHLIEPLGVATRQSTDVLAVEDPDTIAAARFIREHACEGISIKDILLAFPQSRRSLEARFRKWIGHTLHEEIIRIRINRVKTLLTETNLPLKAIAKQTGFTYVEYLSVAFRRETGLPPGLYRIRNRSLSNLKE